MIYMHEWVKRKTNKEWKKQNEKRRRKTFQQKQLYHKNPWETMAWHGKPNEISLFLTSEANIRNWIYSGSTYIDTGNLYT